MTYGFSINGIALENSAYGWRTLRAGTTTKNGIAKTIQKVPVPGRSGYNPGPTTWTEQTIIFTIRTPLTGLEALFALCDQASVLGRTDDATKVAYCELVSAIASSDSPMDSSQDVTITLSLYQGVWRDASLVSVGPVSITTPVQVLDMLSGISAPIFDPMIFIRGVFGQFTLQDNGGSTLKTTRAWPGDSSHGLLFVGSTNQAFWAAESSPWTPIQDMSQYIDVSGNGGFRLTPKFISGNPSNREVELTLTTLTQTSVTARVKAASAYNID